jgi:serine O-acetyltransferase
MKSHALWSGATPNRITVDWLLSSIHSYQRHKARSGPLPFVLRKWARVRYLILRMLTGADIGIEANLGHRLKLPHPMGVVIHRDAVVGNDCMLMQQVTIGKLADPGVPRLGSGVYVGAGAKILGGVWIGDGARIGANAVVLSDVPADATAVGIPAKIISTSRRQAKVSL